MTDADNITPIPSPTTAPPPKPIVADAFPESAEAGAASPSVEMRIYESDVIVRASLKSVTASGFRFTVNEYLKGTGPEEIIVAAHVYSRDQSLDSREAILFLTLRGGPGAVGSSNSGNFVFSTAHYKNPGGYTIGSLDPAWLPAKSAVGAEGESGESVEFTTDSRAALGGSRQTITLTDLRSKIAWVEGGEGIAGYDLCIRSVLGYLQNRRDYEAYYGRPRPTAHIEKQVGSGAGEGTLIEDFDPIRGEGYHKYWLSGRDANLFRTHLIDDDALATNGYKQDFVIARPLPGGVYQYFLHAQSYRYTPCNFTPEGGTGGSHWTITVTMPEGTLYEAFFDTIESSGTVGAWEDTGLLSPNAFDLGGVETGVEGLKWENETVTLELSDYVSLAGHVMDFISLDGSVGLSLSFDDATVDRESDTYAWTVAEQPWHDGDQLMLRIHD